MYNNRNGQPNPKVTYPRINQEAIVYTNPLDQKVIDERLSEGTMATKREFTITEDDINRAICTHRDRRGNNQAVTMSDGLKVCKICGQKYRLIDNLNRETVIETVNNMTDIMNTIKEMWLSIPDELVHDYFECAAQIEQIPNLFDCAMDFLNRLSNANQYDVQYSNANAFNTLGSIYGNNNGPQQQFVNQGYAAPPRPANQQFNTQYDPQQMMNGSNRGFGNTVPPVVPNTVQNNGNVPRVKDTISLG